MATQIERDISIAKSNSEGKSGGISRIIVEAIENDILGRRGIKNEWNRIDDSVRNDIKDYWIELINHAQHNPPVDIEAVKLRISLLLAKVEILKLKANEHAWWCHTPMDVRSALDKSLDDINDQIKLLS